MVQNKTSALVLFAHGARDNEWSLPFQVIRDSVAGRRPDLSVELAFLELMKPSLADSVERLVRDGHTHVTIAPLFLAQGGHLKQDLPRLLQGLTARHPEAKILALPPIGEVAELLDAIAEWLVNGVPR